MNDGLTLFLGSLGAGLALFTAWRTARRVVHVFDAMEKAATHVAQAAEIILHQFSENGGRIEQPLREEHVGKATIVDLLLDIRSALHRAGVAAREAESKAANRSDAFLEALKKTR